VARGCVSRSERAPHADTSTAECVAARWMAGAGASDHARAERATGAARRGPRQHACALDKAKRDADSKGSGEASEGARAPCMTRPPSVQGASSRVTPSSAGAPAPLRGAGAGRAAAPAGAPRVPERLLGRPDRLRVARLRAVLWGGRCGRGVAGQTARTHRWCDARAGQTGPGGVVRLHVGCHHGPAAPGAPADSTGAQAHERHSHTGSVTALTTAQLQSPCQAAL